MSDVPCCMAAVHDQACDCKKRDTLEARIREQRELLDECKRALTYYAATVSESRRCYAVNLLAKLRSQEKADEVDAD